MKSLTFLAGLGLAAMSLVACNPMSNEQALRAAGVSSPYDHTDFDASFMLGAPVIVAKDGSQVQCGVSKCWKVNPDTGAFR